MLLNCLCVGLGGFVGAIARFLVSLLPINMAGLIFTTFSVNFIGSLVIGLISELAVLVVPIDRNLLLFLTVGLMGGFTTFSTFSLESFNLLENGEFLLAGINIIGSVLLCLLGVFVGKGIIHVIAS